MATIRVRLTLWYATVVLLAGVVLLALVYLLVTRAFPESDPGFLNRVQDRPGVQQRREDLEGLGFNLPEPRNGPGAPPIRRPGDGPGEDQRVAAILDVIDEARAEARDQALQTFAVQSGVALVGMLAVSMAAGWFISGRMLRPVSEITGTMKRINAERLHERVALEGPRDELKELGDQFDAMLDRLDGAFRAQREFVANASHELRTPLAVMRAELDVTFDDPDATPEEMRHSADVVRRAILRSEALISALLTLERADAPLARADAVDLADVLRTVLDARADPATARGIEIRPTLSAATVSGDRVLLERMAENLIANAIAYNVDGGWIDVETSERDGQATLRVANPGDRIEPDSVESLFERFTRRDDSRSRESGGYGVGLAIVRAVARHHGGDATARALDAGGLEVVATMPAR